MKVLLEYEPISGQLYDKNGVNVGTYNGVTSCEYGEESSYDIIEKMIDAGYKSDELIELKKKGVI